MGERRWEKEREKNIKLGKIRKSSVKRQSWREEKGGGIRARVNAKPEEKTVRGSDQRTTTVIKRPTITSPLFFISLIYSEIQQVQLKLMTTAALSAK